MPSYVTVHRTATPEELSPLVTLAEALLDRPISAGVTLRNVVLVPRTGRLYIHADAPEPALVMDLFDSAGLEAISVVEAEHVDWRSLIGTPAPGGNGTTLQRVAAIALRAIAFTI